MLALVEAIDELVVVVRPGQVRVGPVYSDVVLKSVLFTVLSFRWGRALILM